MSAERRQGAYGIIWVIIAVLLLATMDALLKWMVARYPVLQIVFLRNVIALLPVAVYIWRGPGWAAMRTDRLPALLGRSLLSLVAMALLTLALGRMQLAEATAVLFVAPLFVTALSIPLLAEHVGIHRWAAVLFGFAGVLIMVRPGAGVLGFGAVLALGSALFYALTMIAIRYLSRTESTAAIVGYNQIGIAAVTGVFMPIQWVTPTPIDTALFVALGLLGGFGQLALTKACRLAPVSVLAPFDYTSMLWAVLLGFWIWRELPDAFVIVGAVIVAASGIYIVHHETRPDVELHRGDSPDTHGVSRVRSTKEP